MIEQSTIKWINNNLGLIIDKAIDFSRKKNPDLLYTRDWLIGMAYRETGFLIARYVEKGYHPAVIYTLMRGDFSQRPGEKEKSYHGFGIWQIDSGSYPAFIKSGDWKDSYKTCLKAIEVLEEKRHYLVQEFPKLKGEEACRAITAAYNCGQGNVKKVLNAGQDVDLRTHQHNYSAEVWRFREIAKTLQ